MQVAPLPFLPWLLREQAVPQLVLSITLVPVFNKTGV